MKANLRNSVCLFVLAAGLAPAAALAQDGAPKDDRDIVVTALRQEQKLQDVAASVQVVTAEALKEDGVTNIADAIETVPGVKIQTVAGSSAGRVFIRGIGTVSGDEFDSVIANGVAINLDGVNSNNAANTLSSMFDVDRVEVLKGPQGTLYGASALGGVVNIVSARPKHKFEGKVRSQVGNYNEKIIDAMVNLPLSPTLAVRLSAGYNDRDGYVGGPTEYAYQFPAPISPLVGTSAPADNHGAITQKTGKVKLLWEPSDRLSVLASYEKTKTNGTSPVWLLPEDVEAGNLVCCRIFENGGPPDVFTSSWYETTYYRRESETWSGEVSYDLGTIGTVTYTPSYNKFLDTGGETGGASIANAPYKRQTQQSHELRLVSSRDAAISYAAGLYYTKSGRNLAINGISEVGPSSNVDDDLDTLEYSVLQAGRPLETFNAYGQVSVPVGEKLKLTAGGRYAQNKAGYNYYLYRSDNPCTGMCPSSDTIAEISSLYTTTTKHPNFSWKLGAEYKPNEDSLLYATIATGFKTGGVQTVDTGAIRDTTDPVELGSYKNEKTLSFELGSKNVLAGGRVILNASAFYTTWKNMQLNTLTCRIAGCDLWGGDAYSVWFNAGPSHQYGLEVEGNVKLTDVDQLSFSANLMHGEYGYTHYAWGAPGFSGYVDLKGRTMANTPTLAGNASYSHRWDLDNGAKLTAKLDTEYSTKYQTTHEYFFAGHEQKGYIRNNASISYAQGDVTVNAYVRNIQNKTLITSVFPFGVQGSDPRVYGMNVEVKF